MLLVILATSWSRSCRNYSQAVLGRMVMRSVWRMPTKSVANCVGIIVILEALRTECPDGSFRNSRGEPLMTAGQRLPLDPSQALPLFFSSISVSFSPALLSVSFFFSPFSPSCFLEDFEVPLAPPSACFLGKF